MTSHPNIILINLDGFRFDKIDLCHNLKNLKETSYFFSKMFTVAPYTFAALPAVFSGMYPSRNGSNAYYNMFKFKKNEITTLTEVMKKAGYFTSCDIIDDSVVPDSGFDEYGIYDEENTQFLERHKEIIQKLSKKEPFFLFLHNTETHKHLVRSIVQKYSQKDNDDEYYESQSENHQRYNSYLPLCDDYVAGILDTLKKCGIYENTILIFFADHGTSIGEKKGEKFYGVFSYDYTIKVFCILHIPTKIPKIIDTQCRTIDIFPTISELLGIKLDDDEFKMIQGESLLPLITNPSSEDRDVFVETGGLYGPWPSPKRHNVFCARINNKKLIYNDTPQTWEFYELDNDPNEINNKYDVSSKDVIFLKRKLIQFLEENKIKTNISG